MLLSAVSNPCSFLQRQTRAPFCSVKPVLLSAVFKPVLLPSGCPASSLRCLRCAVHSALFWAALPCPALCLVSATLSLRCITPYHATWVCMCPKLPCCALLCRAVFPISKVPLKPPLCWCMTAAANRSSSIHLHLPALDPPPFHSVQLPFLHTCTTNLHASPCPFISTSQPSPSLYSPSHAPLRTHHPILPTHQTAGPVAPPSPWAARRLPPSTQHAPTSTSCA